MFISGGGAGRSVGGSSADQILVCKTSDARASGLTYVCDGVRDEIQIQAAIDAANAMGGGTVKILGGTYNISQTIYPKSNVTILMESTTILRMTDQFVTALAADYTADSLTLVVDDASGFDPGMGFGIIRGSSETIPPAGYRLGKCGVIVSKIYNTLTLSSPLEESFSASDHCVVFTHVSTLGCFNVNDVTIKGGELDGNKAGLTYMVSNADNNWNGIPSAVCDNLLIDGVTVHDYWFQGIHPWGGHNNYKCINCVCYDNTFAGICLDTVNEGLVVENCETYRNGSGVQTVDCDNILIKGGYHHHNINHGIQVSHTYGNKDIQINGVNCYENSKAGIYFGHVSAGVIVGGLLRGNGESGIEMSGTIYTTINDTVISDSPIGIFEHNGSDYNSIGESVIFKGVADPIVSDASNTKLPTGGAVPEYREIHSFSGSFNLPSGLPQNTYQVEVRGQSVINIMGDYGDIAKHTPAPAVGNALATREGVPSDWCFKTGPETHQDSDVYAGGTIRLIAGTGAGQVKHCLWYDPASDNICGEGAWNPLPDGTTVYELHRPASYQARGLHGNLNINSSGSVANIDGFMGLDCLFTDFEWPAYPRGNYIRFASVAGHKYLLLLKARTSEDGRIEIWQFDVNTGQRLQQIIKGPFAAWSTVLATAVSAGDDLVFGLFSGYPLIAYKGWVKDIMVLDLSVAGDEFLSLDELYTKYGTYVFTSGAGEQFSVPGCLRTYKDKYLRNILGSDGNITIHSGQYEAGGTYGTLYLWKDGLSAIVDGHKCLDGFWSDYDWVNAKRCIVVSCPIIRDHKYLFRATVKGKTSILSVDAATGATLKQSNRNIDSWSYQYLTHTGNGDDLNLRLLSEYIAYGYGYFRDLLLIDLTYIGDDALADAELFAKYDQIDYFDNILYRDTDNFRDLYIPQLYKVRQTADSVTADGIWTKRVDRAAIDDPVNKIANPHMTLDTNSNGVADGFTVDTDASQGMSASVDSHGQNIIVNGYGSYLYLCQEVLVRAGEKLSLAFVAAFTPYNGVLNGMTGDYELQFYTADNSLISTVTGSSFFNTESQVVTQEAIQVPAGSHYVRVRIGFKGNSPTGCFKLSQVALVCTTELELDNGSGYMRYKLPAEVRSQLETQLTGLGMYGDPLLFMKVLRGHIIYAEGMTSSYHIVPEILPVTAVLEVRKLNRDGEKVLVEPSNITLAEGGGYFTINNATVHDVYEYRYEHGHAGISPEIIVTAPANSRAQYLMNSEIGVNTDSKTGLSVLEMQILIEALYKRIEALENR
ncbi:MAG: right-handed parallel beta-helix repeat-containing protein [Syntrophomonas sp.]|nr:right-handed parallel beta-helix repeat-containing protein [Syntrophomonas sp.]